MFPVQATKTLVVGRKQGDSNFVHTCLRTQLMMELNQKLTKKMFNAGCLRGGNIPTYVRTWRLKWGEGVCSKGTYFRELTV